MRQREDWSRTSELLTNPQVNGTQRVGKSTSIGSAAGPYNYSKNYNPISHLTSELISEESNINANSEKELGNECFKQKKFNEAIDYYSRSIALSPTTVSYANRAMTYLKIKRFQEAENDCIEALNLDDRYIKAYSRRSTTRKELGKLKESIEDAEFALRLEPQNPQMKKQYGEVKALYEKECQIKAVMYADEIEQYTDKLKLINTYLISTARVKVLPTSYGKPIHKFYWILDKETVIEHIKPSNELEKPLPSPTKLNITIFDRIPHLMVDSAAEIGILN